MVINTTFNNNSVILWRLFLLLEDIRVLGGNHRPVASRRQTLTHNVGSNIPRQSMWYFSLFLLSVLIKGGY